MAPEPPLLTMTGITKSFPGGRALDGVDLESVTRNVSVSTLSRFSRGGWLDRKEERAAAQRATRELSLRPDKPDARFRTLSGGNQQQAALARWLLRGCRVLLLDEPTRGVDVGARAELYAVIRRLADEGLANWAFVGQFRFGRRADGTPAPFDPLRYVLKQPHRYPLFHVKDGTHDESARDGYRMVDVGDGDIDYKRFISAVNKTHGGYRDHHWQTEHDNPVESFAFARKSGEHLHSLRERGC